MTYIILALIVLSVVKVVFLVNQSEAYVIERLGTYNKTVGNGLHIKIPYIDVIRKKVTLKEQLVDFEPQAVITKDNVTMRINTVVFYQIVDPKLFTYGVSNPMLAIDNLTATSLRNIIGALELDQTLTSRETINTKMKDALEEATNPWGIKVNRVELKDIKPPKEITDVMEKQMRAERERRESILQAEGEKASSILISQGRKESMLLDAQADKEASILKAQASKESAILNAEAEKIKRILEAEGAAQAMLKVSQAESEGISLLKKAGADEAVLKLKSLEALGKLGEGQATKIIVPTEIQSMSGLVTSITEVGKTEVGKTEEVKTEEVETKE